MARPGFILCLCPDGYLARVRIDQALADGTRRERHAFWGDEPLPDAFWEHLTLQGLFAVPKAVIVHNAQNIPADSWRKISAAISSPNAETWPFFHLQVPFERGKPKVPTHIANLGCYGFAEKQGWIWTIPGLDDRSKAAFIRKEAEARNLTFAPGALEAVIFAMPLDARTIGSELDKLALVAEEGGLITSRSAAIVDKEIEPDVFSIIRNLQHGNNRAVWEQALLSEGGSDSMAFSFLAMLAREARQLWQIAMNEPVRLPHQVLATKTSLARNLGTSGIAKLWHLALEADKGVKTGEHSPDQALDSLLASLSLLMRPPGGGR